MSIPDPIQNPTDWDSVVIAGQVSPGLCNVGEFKRKWAWDEKSGKGAQGGVLSYTNKRLCRGQLEFLLLTGPRPTLATDPPSLLFGPPMYTMLDDFLSFAELFQYDPTKKIATAISIYHPSFATIKLKAVVCEDISNFVRVRTGLYKVVVSLIEYAPPVPVSAVSTPMVAASVSTNALNKPPGSTPDPADLALQKQIAAQLAIAQGPP